MMMMMMMVMVMEEVGLVKCCGEKRLEILCLVLLLSAISSTIQFPMIFS